MLILRKDFVLKIGKNAHKIILVHFLYKSMNFNLKNDKNCDMI